MSQSSHERTYGRCRRCRQGELLALKRAVSELGSIGRNINQIARAANQGERASGPSREDLRAILRVCEGLRDHVKGLLSANLKSWEQGYADPVV